MYRSTVYRRQMMPPSLVTAELLYVLKIVLHLIKVTVMPQTCTTVLYDHLCITVITVRCFGTSV